MARNEISNTLIKSKQNYRIREVIEVSCKIETLSRVCKGIKRITVEKWGTRESIHR